MVDDPGPAILVGEFDDVDAAADPRRFATWMDHQRRGAGDPLLTALGIGTGDAALDLGCGTGVDLAAMATRTVRAVGVDRSATMSSAEAARYTRSLEEAEEAGGFFFAAVSVAVLATAPG